MAKNSSFKALSELLRILRSYLATFVTSVQTFHPFLVYCHLWKWFQTAGRTVQRRNK